MTLIHIVLFKFRPEITAGHKATFVRELRKLKDLSCVKDGRLIVGGPSVTDPIERSKGFQYALVSYHEDLEALAEYQASPEHHWVTSTYMFPYKEDLCRFDFEVEPEDEYMCNFIERSFAGKKQDSVIGGVITPTDSDVEREAGPAEAEQR
ncbi:uncharacterized protein N0V89_010693 [Didymosphaeria variabile]|uniref:Stress-response A/B barrel domain-containing protein n=1 Tax=Didymosphaeria variabile TaxID=1932322 RepID=A0A9W9C6D6_9PLEO|nr:uncharacterized protein N0V89_010693 [Didymosphaeria variabile]KAJ4346761.1 hypothetical protein N0V89_010693 [Didymosphaeria variabile]